MMRVWIVVCFLVCTPIFVSAQVSEEFTIRVFGGVDVVAPSTPTIQSIVPITFSQIDLTWSTSTDNFGVFGYVVSRDGVAISTTTAQSYSDTGLTASTTYSYTVQAFDGVPNYSSSSLSVSTTTPDIPIIPIDPETPAQLSTIARVALASFDLEVDATAARFVIDTRTPVSIEIRIGETSSYEIGYITGTRFARDHNVPVSDLRPDTTYYYEVYGYTPYGMQSLLQRGTFVTASDQPLFPPANVSLFTATRQAQDVLLEWQLPNNLPADGRVRVVRSHYGYPTFINDGVIVYEGTGEQAWDLAVLDQYDRVYYTAFVIDPNGRVSSGAIAVVSSQTQSGSTEQPDSGASNPAGEQGEFNPDSLTEVISLEMPEPSDISITQSGELFTMASDTIPLSSDDMFTVSIPAETIEGDFKTIVATLSDPRGSQKTFSFLLRLNSDRTVYQATIASVQVPGKSDFMVEIYDYDSLVVARYMTEIIFTPNQTVASSTLEVLWWQLATAAWYGALAIPFLVLLWLWLIYRRRGVDEVAR